MLEARGKGASGIPRFAENRRDGRWHLLKHERLANDGATKMLPTAAACYHTLTKIKMNIRKARMPERGSEPLVQPGAEQCMPAAAAIAAALFSALTKPRKLHVNRVMHMTISP